MAGSSLLTLIDDIATILDDVAILSKIAAKKTAGVIGDDLALNAEQVSGIKADRELPVVWAVAKGSFKNKLILVPAALLISAFLPWLIIPLLMLGGAFLCYEGFEKIVHKLRHKSSARKEEHDKTLQALMDPKVDLVAYEKNKIKGAIRTDFILSAEIIVIALGTVKDAELMTRALVVSGIALAITVFVYGLVALIVKLDDVGLYLVKQQGKQLWNGMKRAIGRGLLIFAPFLMKTLAIVGTAAMFLVGGDILLHGMHFLQPSLDGMTQQIKQVSVVGSSAQYWLPPLLALVAGIIAGGIIVGVEVIAKKLFNKAS